MQHVQDAVLRFRDLYFKKHAWRDEKGLTFSRGPNHGGLHLPPWRRKKLTFNLPNGFHFDVRRGERRSFDICDELGRKHNFEKYTNIDPHGYLRGGS